MSTLTESSGAVEVCEVLNPRRMLEGLQSETRVVVADVGWDDFEAAKLAVYAAGIARQSNDADDYPNPDLAVEIDISEPRIDRPDIYSKLQLPEVWRAYKGSVSIEQLGTSGTYVKAPRSRFLPVRPEDVMRFIFGEESGNKKLLWEQLLREWVRTSVVDSGP
jgi:hypothetical protein